VKIRHAAALASVGWYLMMPPTEEQLDSTCRGGPSVIDYVAALIGRDDADKVQTRRCDQEGVSLFWTIVSLVVTVLSLFASMPSYLPKLSVTAPRTGAGRSIQPNLFLEKG
jgi:hypothetical protein